MPLDLHIHSTHSDGTLTPAQIVEVAAQKGLCAVGLTDHDATSGLPEFMAAGDQYGVAAVPGVEINTDVGRVEAHILGYYLDWRHATLEARLSDIRQARVDRAAAMVEKLQALGVNLQLHDVLALVAEGSVGRPHVAQALVRAGVCASMSEAFARFLKRGRAAYVPRYKLTPEEAVDLIRAAGGLCVLAHPGLIYDNGTVHELLELPLDGIEAYHAEHSAAMAKRYVRLARERGLLVTGGSDSHGPDATRPVEIGSVPVPDSVWPELQAAAEARAASGPL